MSKPHDDDWKAIAEDREREAALARRNEAASARRAEKAMAELDVLPAAMRVAQIFVDTMEGQKACCACMERLTMDSPQQGHAEGCPYAALVELVEPRSRKRQIKTDERRIELQAAVDKAYGALSASQYVGGPTEREAWLTAAEALGPLATEHTADNPDAHKGRKS